MVIEIVFPILAEGVTSAEVIDVLVAVGDSVEDGQGLIEVETDKAAAEVPATGAGVVKEIRVKVGDDVPVGAVIVVLEAAEGDAAPAKAEAAAKVAVTEEEKEEKPAAPAEEAAPAPLASAPAMTVPEPGKLAAAAPSVRRFAREIGVDVNHVPGSGPKGRVSAEDVKRHAKSLNEGRAAVSSGGGVAVPPLPNFEAFGEVRREAMSKMRRRTAQNMVLSVSVVPHVTQCGDADVTHLEAVRKRYGARIEKAGGKLTMTAILVKVAAVALRRFPVFNASVDMQRNEIVYKSYYNVGVAVDTGKGLVVPVIQDAARKSIAEIAADLTGISQRVRAGKIRIGDLEGGTFTISNVGGIGGTYFTPIVNYPEVAILGAGRAKQTPVLVDGAWEPRLMLPLSLSYDHRIIDGAAGIRFLQWIIDAMEEPLLMSLEG